MPGDPVAVIDLLFLRIQGKTFTVSPGPDDTLLVFDPTDLPVENVPNDSFTNCEVSFMHHCPCGGYSTPEG